MFRHIFSLHRGQSSFCLSQLLIHFSWNLWEHASALTIYPVCKSSKQIAHESRLFISSFPFFPPLFIDPVYRLEDYLLLLYFFSSYLKLGIELMMSLISSGDGIIWPFSSILTFSSPSSPYSSSLLKLFWLKKFYPLKAPPILIPPPFTSYELLIF